MKRLLILCLLLPLLTGCGMTIKTVPIPGPNGPQGLLVFPVFNSGEENTSADSGWKLQEGQQQSQPPDPKPAMACKQTYDVQISYIERVYAGKKGEFSQFLKDTGNQVRYQELLGALEQWYPGAKTEAQSKYAECLGK